MCNLCGSEAVPPFFPLPLLAGGVELQVEEDTGGGSVGLLGMEVGGGRRAGGGREDGQSAASFLLPQPALPRLLLPNPRRLVSSSPDEEA